MPMRLSTNANKMLDDKSTPISTLWGFIIGGFIVLILFLVVFLTHPRPKAPPPIPR